MTTIAQLITYLQGFDPDTFVFVTEEDAAENLPISEDGTNVEYIALDVVLKWS